MRQGSMSVTWACRCRERCMGGTWGIRQLVASAYLPSVTHSLTCLAPLLLVSCLMMRLRLRLLLLLLLLLVGSLWTRAQGRARTASPHTGTCSNSRGMRCGDASPAAQAQAMPL
jgi:hypothetical protein